jgi:zinc D-Ala-D-Ala carboxypeptidase
MMDRTLLLSPHFSLGEFVVSDEYPQLLDKVELDDCQISKLYYLVTFCLERIRQNFGLVRILSGFRTPQLNKKINGSKSSQHMRAEACDFTCPGKDMENIFHWMVVELMFPGEILYYTKKNFIHVAMPRIGVFADKKHIDKE